MTKQKADCAGSTASWKDFGAAGCFSCFWRPASYSFLSIIHKLCYNRFDQGNRRFSGPAGKRAGELRSTSAISAGEPCPCSWTTTSLKRRLRRRASPFCRKTAARGPEPLWRSHRSGRGAKSRWLCLRCGDEPRRRNAVIFSAPEGSGVARSPGGRQHQYVRILAR